MLLPEINGHILAELQEVFNRVDWAGPERLAAEIRQARRVFVAGQGRSGLVMKAFAMRLMHLGLAAFVAGETVTPSFGAGDLLVVCSTSGETALSLAMARLARATPGGTIAVITTQPDSTLARLADLAVVVPAGRGGVTSRQPLNTLSEQTILLLLDGVILHLLETLGQSAGDMAGRHASLE